jgi:hypothetical protein
MFVGNINWVRFPGYPTFARGTDEQGNIIDVGNFIIYTPSRQQYTGTRAGENEPLRLILEPGQLIVSRENNPDEMRDFLTSIGKERWLENANGNVLSRNALREFDSIILNELRKGIPEFPFNYMLSYDV